MGIRWLQAQARRLFGASTEEPARKTPNATTAAPTGSAPAPPPKLDSGAIRQQQLRNIEKARELVNRSESESAFAILNSLKAQRARLKDIDYLRAICFGAWKQSVAATEALKEELRYFPENQPAAEMLTNLLTQDASESQVDDAEFRQILKVIRPYTMVGESRLLSLFCLAKRACEEDLPGNFVECGVAAGGSSALLATMIARHSKRPRKLFCFDTFEGMPEASALDLHAGKAPEETGWGAGTCSAPQASLGDVCRKLGVEHLVEPVQGLFADTLPAHRARIGEIAFLHLDGDWYHSTRDILHNLFDVVSVGAPLQVDDYGFWDGCKRAIVEFQQERSLNFRLNEIDGIGVWFLKDKVGARVSAGAKTLLNIGCGRHGHEDWVNLDLVAHFPGVTAHDIRTGLPFPDNSFSAVYHSHVLEHLRRSAAPAFLRECHRVLAPGGILRVVVPNLETIARLYLKNLEGAVAGDPDAAQRYEWMILELLDQMVRDEGGGEMLKYWRQNPMPAESFVIERMGSEVRQCLEALRRNASPASAQPAREPSVEKQVEFRGGGEVHKWMYDRWSLGQLLEDCGFSDIRVCAASESRIPGFSAYLLDCEEDGSTRKPDSLFIEAQRPLA